MIILKISVKQTKHQMLNISQKKYLCFASFSIEYCVTKTLLDMPKEKYGYDMIVAYSVLSSYLLPMILRWNVLMCFTAIFQRKEDSKITIICGNTFNNVGNDDRLCISDNDNQC